MAAFMMIGLAANAQTIENDGVFSHMNIGVKGVADYSYLRTLDEFGFNALNYGAALELGKDITPITGISLEGIAMPKFEDGFGINRTDLFANAKFNLMNLFGGYKGMPRRFETKLVGGIGWNHNFNSNNPNDIALQGGLECDFNLGRNRNWYITFSPMLQANDILQSEQILYAVRNSDVKASIGIAYRLGRGNGSHNFKIAETSVNESDYNELVNKYNELLNNKEENDTVVIEKVVEKVIEKTVVKPSNAFIGFEKGSSKISASAAKTIENFANTVKDMNYTIKVVGSADSATGSKEVNENLAWERANNVAKELVKYNIDKVATEIVIDVNGANEASRCAIIVTE